MAYAKAQRTVHKVGSVLNWLQRTDLADRRIRLIDLEGQVRLALLIDMSACNGKT